MLSWLSDFLYMVILWLIKCWKLLTWLVIQCCLSESIKIQFLRATKKMGIVVNGTEDHDIQVYDERLYNRVAQDGSLGLGEAYLDGWWDCKRMDKMFHKLAIGNAFDRVTYPWDRFVYYLQFHLFNLQTTQKSLQVIKTHYDIGNEFFESFLDPSMTYSCAYWRKAKNLNEAQQHKMELIGRKLKLAPGMRVLDIGCGWGGLCAFLAEKYEVSVVGINISQEGVKVAKQRCKDLTVEIRLMDYRSLINEKFDRIVSVGMFEHVGVKNYPLFFDIVHSCLDDGGIFLLHTIGEDNDRIPRIEPWMHTYIFPGGNLPRPMDITRHVNCRFTIEDWHNFGHDYNRTLLAWHSNFVKGWPRVKHLFKENEERAFRMFTVYFLCSAGMFSARKSALWQIVLTKNGLLGGYESVR